MLQQFHRFRRWAGVDRAVFFSNAAQLIRLFTGPITMALVLKYLTPEIQGYWYAFSGIVATQIFLEMGFSQNILQFASHEFAKLRFTDQQTLEGDAVAKSRLISVGRLAFGYYAVAAAVFLIAVGIGGHIFFTAAAHRDPAHHFVAWQGAWWIIVVTAALALAVNPAMSLLQGCNEITALAKFNFWTSLGTFGANAIALVAGAGIYASAIGAAFSLVITVAYYSLRWRGFFRQFLEQPQHGQVSWRHEIWPFQWRIAVSWAASYFIFDVLSPIAFYFCGSVDAGRLGMSMNLIRMIFLVALTWVSTKAPQFGMLISRRAWAEFDVLWRRSTIQAFFFYLLGITAFLCAIPLVGHFVPRLPARLAPMPVNFWMGAALVCQIFFASMAMELRAHKREPFMWISVADAVLSMAFILPLVYVWGITGEAMGFALATWAVFFPSVQIYRSKRIAFRNQAAGPAEMAKVVSAADFS